LGIIETMKVKKTAEDPNHNRTMVFYVGRQDIKLISPDRKQVLLHKMLKDITTCTQVKAPLTLLPTGLSTGFR